MKSSGSTTTKAALTAILERLPGNSASRQRQRMLLALHAFGSVTTVGSTRFLDVIDPRARVFELRSEGHSILTGTVTAFTESGLPHTVGNYLLDRRAALSDSPQRDIMTQWTQLQLPFGS